MTNAFYLWAIRVGPAILLGIALVNLLGSIGFLLATRMQQGLAFGLSAALSSTLIPLIAAFVFLRFDLWFASRRNGAGE